MIFIDLNGIRYNVIIIYDYDYNKYDDFIIIYHVIVKINMIWLYYIV